MTEQPPSKDQLYYLQVRGFVGNSLLWWRKGRHGYTTDINQAHVFTKDEAFGQQRARPDEDFPWRKDYIDSILQQHARPDEDFPWRKDYIDSILQQYVHCEKVDRDAEAAYSGHEPPADAVALVDALENAARRHSKALQQTLTIKETEAQRNLDRARTALLAALGAAQPPGAKPSDDAVSVLLSLLDQCRPYVVKADREGPHAHPSVLLNQIDAAASALTKGNVP